MTDLRQTLDSLARTPSPDLWPDIQARDPRPLPPRRRSGLVAVVGLVVLLCAAAIVLPLRLAGRSGPVTSSPPVSSAPLPSFSPHVAATIPVGPRGQVTSVAYGHGSVWVAAYVGAVNQRDVVRRIDPATNTIVATIEVPGVPPWEIGGGGMTFGDGSLWVVGGTDRAPTHGRTDGVVTRIDPGTTRVTAVIDVGGSSAADVAIDGAGTVWAGVFGDGDSQAELVQVDAKAAAVVARFPVGADYIRRVAATNAGVLVEEYVWPGARLQVERLDPRSGGVELAPVTSHAGGALVQWNDQIWCSTDLGFVRIDPATGGILGEPIPKAVAWGWVASAADDGIWFQQRKLLGRLDPTTRIVQRVFEGPGAQALAVGGDALWLIVFDGRLIRVDLH